MVYNPTKTEFITFGNTEGINLQLDVMGVKVPCSKTIKILGITFQSNLRWESLIKNTLNSANSLMYAFRYLNNKLTRPQFRQIIHAHYISKIAYAMPVWGRSINQKMVDRLNSSIFKMLRLYCFDFNRELHRADLVRTANIRTFPSMRIISDCKMLHKLCQAGEPPYISERLRKLSYKLSRYPGRLFFHSAGNKHGKKCFINRAKFTSELMQFQWMTLSESALKQKINNITPRFIL